MPRALLTTVAAVLLGAGSLRAPHVQPTLAGDAFITAPPPAAAPPAAPQQNAQQTQPNGRRRLFPPQDLGLLSAPDRDDWSHPDLIMDALAIADGAVVADLGAGGGWFSIRLARRVRGGSPRRGRA